MANMDHIFIKIVMVKGKPDALAVARTDRKGVSVCSYSGGVSTSESFSDLLATMKREVLNGLSKEYVVIAHYAEVERTILSKEYGDKPEMFDGRLWLSTSQLLWPLVDCQIIPSVTFETVCAYFGVRIVDLEESAERDCTALVRVFFELMRRYRSSLLVEEGVRDFGGPTLDKVRKMIGL